MPEHLSTTAWAPDSWKSKPIKQDVVYDDPKELEEVVSRVANLPPLVSQPEIDRLRAQLRDVAEGRAFLLQGGDCAESFDYCEPTKIEDKLKILLQMSLVLVWGMRLPIVRIARMAGQYAKPRSSAYETVNGEQILSYRGDNVNGIDPGQRRPDPQRLLSAYFHSASTINYVRLLLDSGFADIHQPEAWDLGYVRKEEIRHEYQTIVNRLTDALGFMGVIGATGSGQTSALSTVDLYTSHEALLLEYEQALTRAVAKPSERGGRRQPYEPSTPPRKPLAPELCDWYNMSAHFIWIGDRTRQLDGAHIEYFRGVKNPVGVKVGPSMEPAELVRVLGILDPLLEPGRVTLITRYGAGKIADNLPAHIKAVQATAHRPVWCCDPCHGNTTTAPTGHKTRSFDAIISEITSSISIHRELGSRLSGVHLELTGEHVTECTGGSQELSHSDLPSNYQTFCDPRLNYEQSLDIAFKIAKVYQDERENAC
ncbi:phospho-2-dehydro-3-deoxyheptonate aldolase [Coemansia reversa NRRL 1564]|uniref:Phospho-2-dehydro-3-deoxyheptonate aldolase n=1 Tax=Coemansia reversa (strain ATCC 12441 / NRRL 1564) TaxID=763665 RepID=A0A2G5BCD6_COERN|nr:phospho-2-dehydro-3-deoxyheptonate aldolase [Coemansia reversa NRRL 1564]|eukprot:PIA16661.1 phospho-2-dehydro-3-deoxyheptonate aldolase [Coemansia reversa NRRL 1564]